MADAGDLKGELERRQVHLCRTCRRFFLRGFRGVTGSPGVLDTQMDTAVGERHETALSSCARLGMLHRFR
jgi:hypothetical protein